MTYLQIRYVPDSRHVFYRYAFQTLYTLHDASKQGFQRKRFVEMSESDFINVFSLFCLISYADMEHSFTREEILKYLEKVKIRSRVVYSSDNFLKECVESVNLIYRDGDNYSFIHRSFQEYFCAYAVTHYFPDKISAVIEKIPVRRSDAVFPMMYSINPDVLSKMYIVPTYKILQKDMNIISREIDHVNILSVLGMNIDVMFELAGRDSPFGYMVESQNQLKRFSDSVLCMFKSEIPREMSREFSGFQGLHGLVSSLKILTRKNKPQNTGGFYRAKFDFSKRILSISSGRAPFSTESNFVDFQFEQLDKKILSGSYFKEMSQSIKSEIVFSKRKCDEVVRKTKEILRGGDDIFSL